MDPISCGWIEFHIDLVRVLGAEQITLEEHTAIFEAIEVRGPDRAAEAMARHLRRLNAHYRQFEW